ncbi:hypothetical protein DQ354_07540 [Arthrobacter sp. AQ5-06]|nr:hypothetical protein DQ354_07540 [Arthrobacter sp. AQ5-06]
MLEDGSPRYGIRTTGLTAVAEAPTRVPATVEQTAEAAATLDAAELKMALQYRHALRRFTGDADVVAALRQAHPEEFSEAEKMAANRLDSPAIWMRGARKAYDESTIEEADKAGTMLAHIGGLFGSLGLSIAFLTIVVGLGFLDVPPVPSLVVIVGVLVVMNRLQRKLSRKFDPRGLPVRIFRDEAAVLWDDVVSATFLAVLRSKDVPVDIATSAALTRGWNHTRYVASMAQELRTNHADPART